MKEVNKALLESLFYKGHEYREILHILRSQHHINISLRTLKRRLKQYSFQRNGVEFCPGSLRDAIMEIIDGPGSTIGYRSVWHALQRKGIRNHRNRSTTISTKQRFVHHFPAVRHLQCHVSCTRYLGNICNSADCVARQLEP